MSLFFHDTAGDKSLLTKTANKFANTTRITQELSDKTKDSLSNLIVAAAVSDDEEESEDDGNYFGLPPPTVDISKIIDDSLAKSSEVYTKTEHDLSLASDQVNSAVENAKKNKKFKRKRIIDLDYSDFNDKGRHADEALVQVNVAEEMAKSKLQPGFEALKSVPKPNAKKDRQLGRLERAKTKGPGWFNLPATEMTEEVKNDLKILQMRSVLDPKHFYKKNDLKVLPKYFQIGTVQHSPLDYYSERHTRKNKKHSLVEEVLADEAIQSYTKRKYQEVIARTDKYAHRKALKKMRKLKKNK